MSHRPDFTNIVRLGAARTGAGFGRPAAKRGREADRPRIRSLVDAASERARLYSLLARTSRRIDLQVALAGTLACLLALVLEAALLSADAPPGAAALLAQLLALAGPLAVVVRSASHGLAPPDARAASAAAQARAIATFGLRLEALACADARPDGERAQTRALDALLACAESDLATLHLAFAMRGPANLGEAG